MTFLEKNKIRKLFGKDSREYRLFKSKTAEWYDNNISYKFFCRLRDYIVHYDHAIKLVEFDVKPVKEAHRKFSCSCDPMFVKNELLASDSFRSKLAVDLESYNYTFPLLPLLQKIESIIQDILPLILSITGRRYKDAAICLKESLNRFPEAYNVKYGYINKDNPDNYLIQVDTIKDRSVAYIIEFFDVNQLKA